MFLERAQAKHWRWLVGWESCSTQGFDAHLLHSFPRLNLESGDPAVRAAQSGSARSKAQQYSCCNGKPATKQMFRKNEFLYKSKMLNLSILSTNLVHHYNWQLLQMETCYNATNVPQE